MLLSRSHPDHPADHILAGIQVSDHAILKWTDSGEIIILLLEATIRLSTDPLYLVSLLIERHIAWLIDDDLAILYDDRISST